MKKSSRDRRVAIRLITHAYKAGLLEGINAICQTMIVDRTTDKFWNDFIGTTIDNESDKNEITGRDWIVKVEGLYKIQDQQPVEWPFSELLKYPQA